MEVSVRGATTGDAAEIARLSGELGYPGSAEEVGHRLSRLLNQNNYFIAVADQGICLLGWIAVESRLSLETGEKAELTGLVVDARARRAGIGARLVQAAEDWARAAGHATIVVRSNAAREESHPFYMGRGYVRTKTQHAYTKQLAV